MSKKRFKAVSVEKLDNNTIDKVREWRNSDYVRLNSYTRDLISVEQHKNYIEEIIKNPYKGLFVFYLDEEPIGVFQYKIDSDNQIIYPGNYLINSEFSYLGYGAIQLYFQNYIAFEIMGIRKSCGEVLEYNESARTLNEKMGHSEGVLKKQKLIDNQYYDVYLYGLFKDEWIEIKKKYERIMNYQIGEIEIISDKI